MLFRQVTVIGVGLIGGALAIACKRRKLADIVVGYGKRRGELQRALTLGAIDRYFLTLPKAVEGADIVVLAAPVSVFERICKTIAPHLKDGAIVTDVGSVKGKMVSKLSALMPKHASFVGGHPIAGREKSGVGAATVDLFDGSLCVLTPLPNTPVKAVKKVGSLWEGLGAHTVNLDPMVHDKILAASSHLPHLAAYALVETLLHPRIALNHPLQFSGGGLRDFTRIASSPPEMWRDIFLLNKDELVNTITIYQDTLEKIKKKILTDNGVGLLEILAHAQAARQKL